MLKVIITESPDSKKRYRIYFIKEYTYIDIGSSMYENYTIHNDKERKRLYLLRHSKNEDWNDVYSKGFWARWLLWNETTIKKSINFIQNKFKIKIVLIDK
jgi:hypothetical protein